MADSKWGLGSIAFTFVYFVLHMRSVVLAAFSILLIALSLSVAQVIYSGLFQIEYFAALHGLAIFIALGIAADNVFVLFDAWQ